MKLWQSSIAAARSYYPSLLFAFISGLSGALLNLFPISLGPSLSLFLGNSCFLIAAYFLKPSVAAIVALVTAIPLYIFMDVTGAFYLFALEAFFVALFCRRKINLMFADAGYWLVIGLPVAASYLMNISDAELGNTSELVLLIKLCINSVFCAGLASFIILSIGHWFNIKTKRAAQPQNSFRSILFQQSLTVGILLVIGLGLLLSRLSVENQKELMRQRLDSEALYLAHIANLYIEEHASIIELSARRINTQQDFSQVQQILTSIHHKYPGFITLLAADNEGRVISAAPASLLANIPTEALTIEDREYFVHPMSTGGNYTSSPFQGRGFGNDIIVAMSTAIFTEEGGDRPVGIIEGSLNLNMFGHFASVTDHEVTAATAIVLVDDTGKTVFSSEILNIEPLDTFNLGLVGKHIDGNNLIAISQANDALPEYYFYSVKHLPNGWRLYALGPSDVMSQFMEKQYLTIALVVVLLSIVVMFVGNLFAARLTRPIDIFVKAMHGDFYDIEKLKKVVLPESTPKEIRLLFDEFVQNREKISQHKYELEQEVKTRTKQLQQANDDLELAANTDNLTNLANRRALREQFVKLQSILARSENRMMVAVMDLDKFKKINDTYGHAVGDIILQHFAARLSDAFKRDYDIVARFGGEEFVVVTMVKESENSFDMLDDFRESLANEALDVGLSNKLNISVSIGILEASANYSLDLNSWLEQADQALYQAKEEGRNRVCLLQE